MKKNNKKIIIFSCLGFFFLLGVIIMLEESVVASIFYGVLSSVFFILAVFSKFNLSNFNNKATKPEKRYYAKRKKLIYLKDIKNNISILSEQQSKLIEDINNLKLEHEKQLSEYSKSQFSHSIYNAEIKELQNRKKKISEDVDKLQFQKEMLKNEIEELENKQDRINRTISNSLKINPSELSIEYIDNLSNGLEFEQCFASILNLLGYSDISITSSSGDFGIDVLASNDGVLYGFQCKLYSNTVGNDAVQQAYAGRNHYNCNIAIVVTNNYFTNQAKKQAQENRVILWDRNTLIEKIKKANKQNLQFN